MDNYNPKERHLDSADTKSKKTIQEGMGRMKNGPEWIETAERTRLLCLECPNKKDIKAFWWLQNKNKKDCKSLLITLTLTCPQKTEWASLGQEKNRNKKRENRYRNVNG